MTESEVYQLLKNDSGVNALVNGRIYPLVAPQNVQIPYMTYQVVSGLKLQCMGGNIYQGNFRFQINVWGTSYSQVKAISEAVKNALVGFLSSNNIDIRDDYDNESKFFGQIIDFKIKG